MTSRRNDVTGPPVKLESVSSILTAAILTAVLCYLTAELAGTLVLRPQMLWPLWPGSALLVALLLLTRRKVWPVLIIAGFAGFMVNDLQSFGLSIRSSGTLIVGDAVEVVVAGLGISYFFGDAVRLNSRSSFAKYFLVAVICAPLFAAFVSATAFRGSYWTFWRISVLTEGLALLTVTPAIIGLVRAVTTWRHEVRDHYLEASAIMPALFVLGYITFILAGRDHPELLYSLLPFLLWSALRLGVTGTSVSIMVVAFLSIWGAVHGHGPFIGRGTIHDVISLQLFLLFAGTSFMFLAAFVKEDRQAKEALQESEEKFRNVFRDAGVGMIILSTEGCFLAANRAFCDCLGYTEEELLEKTIESVTLSEDWPTFSRKLREALRERQGFQRVRKRCMHKSGRIVFTESSASLIRSRDGHPQYFVGEVLDVTKRKEAEEALSGMTRKLIEAQEQERARIGRELHDDINQRLAMLALELAPLRDNPSEIEPRLQKLRKQITEISNDMQDLSHDLSSSKLEYLGVVAGMKSWCREFAERQKMEIDFRSDVADVLPLEVGRSLFRVLQEGLYNAMKHSGVRRVEVRLCEDSGEIHLVVSDLGRGFDVATALQGKGLGLTSMRERVRLVKGTIEVQSQPMDGTTIHIRVPLESEHGTHRAAL